MDGYFDKNISLIIADVFSLVTILSCLVLKVPQIRKIRELQGAEGVSVLGVCLELSVYTVMMAYNYTSGYSLLSYMEYPVLLIQEYVLIYVVFKYKRLLNRGSMMMAVAYFSFLILIYCNVITSTFLAVIVPFCTPVGASSKILQMLAIIKTRNSSSISLQTWAISAFTNFTRIYTVFIESRDIMLLSNFCISFILSSCVFIAALIFKKPKLS